ncbi:MAG: aminotransferase class III-fold pyridoxal phosphate-dependent enzyme [Deltaproteobacteria bacterium]
MSERLEQSEALYQRALAVIPGGVYGHQSPALFSRGSHPVFISAAEGCRIEDPDGNRYIDLLCSYGPMVVGYRNPRVEGAVAEQLALCDSGNLPAPNMVELAERLVGLTPDMDWAMFAKNGSDITTWSLALARESTGREMILMAEGTYHGVHGWCNKSERGFLDSERGPVLTFPWNDLDRVAGLFKEHPDTIAALIVTPFRHEAGAPSEMPAEGFLEGVRELCTRHGALMVVDDIRAGFRLHLGGSTQLWGVSPDMLLYSKALANGYPLAAILGTEELRRAASKVFVTGTFWTQAAPIAAALATLDELEASDAVAHMDGVGRRLSDGLAGQASEAGLTVTMSGPPALPFMTFDEDTGGLSSDSFARSRRFAGNCAENGVFLHPLHNWFLSTAHGTDDIDEILAATTLAFEAVAREF